jgi:hypothetical protein
MGAPVSASAATPSLAHTDHTQSDVFFRVCRRIPSTPSLVLPAHRGAREALVMADFRYLRLHMATVTSHPAVGAAQLGREISLAS